MVAPNASMGKGWAGVLFAPVFCGVCILFYAALRQFFMPTTDDPCSVAFIVLWSGVFWIGAWMVWGSRWVNKQTLLCFLASILCVGFLWRVPLTARQVFFRHAGNVRVGMTVAETEHCLGRYHAVYPAQFDGRNGPSARPLPKNLSNGIVYLRDRRDSAFQDQTTVVFEEGKVVEVLQIAD